MTNDPAHATPLHLRDDLLPPVIIFQLGEMPPTQWFQRNGLGSHFVFPRAIVFGHTMTTHLLRAVPSTNNNIQKTTHSTSEMTQLPER